MHDGFDPPCRNDCPSGYRILGWENNFLLKNSFHENPWVDLCFTQDVAKKCFVVKMEYGDVYEKYLVS